MKYFFHSLKPLRMLRSLLSFLLFLIISNAAVAQQTREELEKQRQQLKREIEETQKLLNSNKAETKENLTRLALVSNKVALQDRVIDNISKDLHILDNNIYTIQRDVNRYDRLLDTLKQEYAKSMVYSYKNRGNYEFLNFIFSADNFNDAIKRVTYLKSYRTYREMQGQNIIRTQELRKKRLEELGASKQKKNSTLEVQSKEMDVLEQQKKEQDRIVIQLKKEGKNLNNTIAAKEKQMTKINNAVKAAIAKAMKEEEDRRKAAAIALKKKEEDDKKKAAAAALAAAAATGTKPSSTSPTAGTPSKKVPIKAPEVIKAPETAPLPSSTTALSANFKNNMGSLPWPVENGRVIMHYGRNVLQSKTVINNTGITIATQIGASVKTVFNGVVILAQEIEEGISVVTVKHGDYYTTYSNLSSVSVKKDQEISTGQVIGRVAANLDGIGAIDFQLAKGMTNYDPEKWLHR